MRHARGLWVCCFLLLSAAVLCGMAALTSDNAIAQAQSTSNPSPANPAAGEARWRDGELIAPLPKDPAKRAEAIRQAKQIAASRTPARRPDIVIQPEFMTMTSHPVYVDKSKLTNSPSDLASRPTPQLPRLINPGDISIPSDIQKTNPKGGATEVESVTPSSMVSGALINFNAIAFTGFSNASPDIDVGPEHVIAVASDMVAVYDKCGNWLEGGTFLDYFGQVSSDTFYDPRVIYDDWRGRWIVVFQELNLSNNDSQLRVAVSNSADPTEGWLAVYIVAWNTTTFGFADNTYISDDPEALYITYNRYDVSSYIFQGTTISIVPKDDLYQSGPVTFPSFINSTNPGDGSQAFAIRPAQMNSWAGETYLINDKFQGGSIGTLWKITGTPASPSLNGYSFGIYEYVAPPAMEQPDGTYIRAGDCRYTDAVYSGGMLYGARTALDSFGAGDKAGVYVDTINPFLVTANTFWMSTPGTARSYPAIDVDEYGNLILATAASSDAMFPSFIYDVLSLYPLVAVESGTIAAGVADYGLGGSGTSGNPYRWGAYSGVALDHADSRTFWTHGAFASIDPVPSWTTKIGAYAYFANGNLNVTPADGLTSGGYEGQSFYPSEFVYTLENTGGTMVNWRLSLIPEWLSPSVMKGQLLPGASQDVTFTVNATASFYDVGEHSTLIWFSNCTGGGTVVRQATLAVVEPFDCGGSALNLYPGIYGGGTLAGEHSVFVTALEDIELCAIAPDIYTANRQPVPVTCRVYEADGLSRGPLMAEVTQHSINAFLGLPLVPVEVTLEACRDYEIAFEIPENVNRGFTDENTLDFPFDVGGVLRVRKGAFDGVAEGTTWLPHMSVLVANQASEWTGHKTDLFPDGPVTVQSTSNSQPGLYIGALENMRLTSIGVEADLIRDSRIYAWLFEATGNVPDNVIATGSFKVDTGGMAEHEVPIHANLEYGQDYHIRLSFDGSAYWPAVNQFDVSLPDTFDGDVEVRKASSGQYLSTSIPHFWLTWDDYANGGYPFDLAKASDGIPPPFTQTGGNLDHDAFVESMTTTQIYGLGVMADIPEGEILLARIYSATETGRDALLAESLLYTSGSGMQWHDVPMAFEWTGGEEIDISFVCANVNELPYWEDSTGFPFTPYGAIQVNDAGLAGDRFYTPYVHMRIHGCDNVPTGIGDDTPSFSPMVINPPIPNPANGIVRFDYSVDQPAIAEMAIYDVLGRRVAVVFAGEQIPAGPRSAQFDASTLASGVYFLKLETPKMAVSRKFVVTH